MFKILVLL